MRINTCTKVPKLATKLLKRILTTRDFPLQKNNAENNENTKCVSASVYCYKAQHEITGIQISRKSFVFCLFDIQILDEGICEKRAALEKNKL